VYRRLVKRALLVVVLACTKTNQLPEEAWGTNDYAAAGIAVDRPWGAAEYERAANVLGAVAKDHPERLPRHQGAKSGAVFARLVADFADDEALPVGERLGPRLQHYEALNAISKLYVLNQLATPPREYIELTGALLRDAAVETELVEAFMATISADDPSRGKREQGRAKMREGFAGMVYGGLLVADQLRLSDEARIAMLGHVTAALPRLFPTLPAEAQRQIRETLAKQVQAFPAGPLRDAAVAAQRAVPD
jgi:hypothetical protein